MENIIRMKRVFANDDATLGVMSFNGFQCVTLEDEYREVKVAGETRIPAGRYEIDLRTESPMADRYRLNFGSWHKGMLWLQDVPGFNYVYIHVGNDDEDTSGCVLVGRTMDTEYKAFSIGYSRTTYEELARRVFQCFDAGEQVFIEIEDAEI